MGFFNLDGFIEAMRMDKLEGMLGKMSKNDLAILKMEIEGYANKRDADLDLEALYDRVEFYLDRK